jgi:hypothetical protein
MHYRAVNELVTSTYRSTAGESRSRYVHAEHKKSQWGKLNYLITGEMNKNSFDIRWKDRWSHTVNDVFNYCPMLLNYLTLSNPPVTWDHKKYGDAPNILFVGHFNSAVQSWTFPRGSDRQLHATPSNKSMDDTMVDPNLWLQFLPIVKMAWKYNTFNMHTLVPTQAEGRFRGIMHSLYKRYEIDLINCDHQYKHGRTRLNIDMLPDTLYDAVVFAGVPKQNDDDQINHHDIRGVFQPYCKPGFDIIDMNYQNTDPTKHIGGHQQDNTDYLNEVYSCRAIWDQRFRELTSEDKALEYAVLNDIVKCYKV